MEDKEIGELWKQAHDAQKPHLKIKVRKRDKIDWWAPRQLQLIRKLIEERQLVHSLNNIISEGEPLARKDSIKGTLDQFGIDPATFSETESWK